MRYHKNELVDITFISINSDIQVVALITGTNEPWERIVRTGARKSIKLLNGGLTK